MGPTFFCLHLCFRQATARRGLSCQWAGSKLRFLQAYFHWLSFPPANFPFDLKVPGFLLGTSHILAEGLWQLNLDSALNSSPLFSQWVFCQKTCWEWAKSSWAGALPCCQRTLLRAVSSCRQPALPWKGVLFCSCSLLYPAVTHPVTSTQTGTFFWGSFEWRTGGLVSKSFVLRVCFQGPKGPALHSLDHKNIDIIFGVSG